METHNDRPKSTSASTGSKSSSLKALQALNFLMVVMQAGIGQFLGIFLLAHGWQSGPIGSVMTIGGAATKLPGNPTIFIALTIIIAQFAMISMSIVAMKVAEKCGYWLVLLISFIALPGRGLIAAQMISYIGLFSVQLLDGLGAGLQSVAVPGLVAHLLNGTGRINIGQGAVMTVQGIGASLSPTIGGWLAQSMGYPSTFLLLGGFASVSIVLWLFFANTLKSACATTQPLITLA